jgi:hypothetical protein
LGKQPTAKLLVVGGEELADRCGMKEKRLAESDIYADWSSSGKSVDVGHVAAERDRKVDVVAGLTSQVSESASSYRAHLNAVDDPNSEPYSPRAKRVAKIFGDADDFGRDHALQQIVTAADRQLEPLTDLRDGHAAGSASEQLEHVERA